MHLYTFISIVLTQIWLDYETDFCELIQIVKIYSMYFT